IGGGYTPPCLIGRKKTISSQPKPISPPKRGQLYAPHWPDRRGERNYRPSGLSTAGGRRARSFFSSDCGMARSSPGCGRSGRWEHTSYSQGCSVPDEEVRSLLAPLYGWFTEGYETADL